MCASQDQLILPSSTLNSYTLFETHTGRYTLQLKSKKIYPPSEKKNKNISTFQKYPNFLVAKKKIHKLFSYQKKKKKNYPTSHITLHKKKKQSDNTITIPIDKTKHTVTIDKTVE